MSSFFLKLYFQKGGDKVSLLGDIIIAGIKGIKYYPVFYEDKKYKVWICMLSPSTCKPCFDLHGKLYLPEKHRPDFQDCMKIALALLHGLNQLKKGLLLMRENRE